MEHSSRFQQKKKIWKTQNGLALMALLLFPLPNLIPLSPPLFPFHSLHPPLLLGHWSLDPRRMDRCHYQDESNKSWGLLSVSLPFQLPSLCLMDLHNHLGPQELQIDYCLKWVGPLREALTEMASYAKDLCAYLEPS